MRIRVIAALLLLLSVQACDKDKQSSAGTYADKQSLMAATSSGEIPNLLVQSGDPTDALAFRANLWPSILAVMQASYGLPARSGDADSGKLYSCIEQSQDDYMQMLMIETAYWRGGDASYRVRAGFNLGKIEQRCGNESPFVAAVLAFNDDYKNAVDSIAATDDKHRDDETVMIVVWSLIALGVILGIYGISLGFRNKVIFYGSGGDVFKSCLLVVMGIVLFFLPYEVHRGQKPTVLIESLSYVLALASFLFVVLHSKSIDREMNVFNAICVALGKTMLFLLAIAQLGRGNDSRASAAENASQKLIGAFILLGIGYLVSRLINRKEYFAVKLAQRFGLPVTKRYLDDIVRWIEEDLNGEVTFENFEEVYALFSRELSSTVETLEATT